MAYMHCLLAESTITDRNDRRKPTGMQQELLEVVSGRFPKPFLSLKKVPRCSSALEGLLSVGRAKRRKNFSIVRNGLLN